MVRVFHLAFPVDDLEKAIQFYHGLLECPVGRMASRWADFDFFGNQITAHLKPGACIATKENKVDGDDVPVRHFGVILDWEAWEELASRLKNAEQDFIIGPKIRFKGKPGEQGTFFIRDPAGNALEFKTFRTPEKVFETGDKG